MMLTVSIIVSLVACYLVLCRIDKMERGKTRGAIFLQHALLGAGLFGSVLLDFTRWNDLSGASASAGVLAFLIFSFRRWRHGAPEDTSSPMPLDEASLRRVSGGKQ